MVSDGQESNIGKKVGYIIAGLFYASIITWVIFGAAVLIALLALLAMGSALVLWARISAKGRPGKMGEYLLPKNADAAMNNGPGTFQYEVVGESYYVNDLRHIIFNAGLKVDEPGEMYCRAFLLCEPKNEYDPNAVVVVVETRRVGYIPRKDAQELAPELRKLANTRTKNGRGGQVLCVQACIGWSGPERIGVRLDLDEFSND